MGTAMRHADIWKAIDLLAERHGLSPSGLARRAGLDPTAFNKSKRTGSDGNPRWLSTESLVKAIEAVGATWEDFAALAEGRPGRTAPLLGFAKAGNDGYFDDAGFPTGDDWDEDYANERTLLRTAVSPDPKFVKWFNPDVKRGEQRDVVVPAHRKRRRVHLDREASVRPERLAQCAQTHARRHVQRDLPSHPDQRDRDAAAVPAVQLPGWHSESCRAGDAGLDP